MREIEREKGVKWKMKKGRKVRRKERRKEGSKEKGERNFLKVIY